MVVPLMLRVEKPSLRSASDYQERLVHTPSTCLFSFSSGSGDARTPGSSSLGMLCQSECFVASFSCRSAPLFFDCLWMILLMMAKILRSPPRALENLQHRNQLSVILSHEPLGQSASSDAPVCRKCAHPDFPDFHRYPAWQTGPEDEVLSRSAASTATAFGAAACLTRLQVDAC